jgi:hypothetical protein
LCIPFVFSKAAMKSLNGKPLVVSMIRAKKAVGK